MNPLETVCLDKVDGFIFDMDGTLYSSKKMNFLMAIDIFIYHVIHPFSLYNIYIIYTFRKHRESITTIEHDLESCQYKKIAIILNIEERRVREVVDTWILRRPLSYIYFCRYKQAEPLFRVIAKNNKKIIISSEYPVEKKLNALKLFSDLNICSLDSSIDAFKPDPKNFVYAAENLNISPSHFLVIGDREDKDGNCARQSGMSFINIKNKQEYTFKKLTEYFQKTPSI